MCEIKSTLSLTTENQTEGEYSLSGVVLQHKGHVTCLIRANDGKYYHFDDQRRSRGMDETFVLDVSFNKLEFSK